MVLAAIGQICSTSSMTHNLKLCQNLISKASAAGAKALFLPEAADYIASSPAETISLCRPASSSEFLLGIRDAARTYRLPVNVGVHEPAERDPTAPTDIEPAPLQRVRNTLLWIDEHGEITQRYQKIHLFDVEVPGGPVLKESRSVQPGASLAPPFATPLGTLGLQICYDLRFPELALRLRRVGAQVLVYPSAFTVPTGRAHWRTLLQAHAIQTQCWVIAAAQVGRHNERRESYGHALVVDAWGEVRVELGGEDVGGEIGLFEVEMAGLEKTRREMPLWAQRRFDVYPEL